MDISHGDRCARILSKLGGLIEPGIEYENGRRQTQCVAIGPVGNWFYRVEFRDGVYYAAKQFVRPKSQAEESSRCFTDEEEAFQSFEDAISRAVMWFSRDLSSENTAIDFAMGYAEYLSEVREAETRQVENAIAVGKVRLSALKQEAEQLKRDCAKATNETAALRQDLAQRTGRLAHYLKMDRREQAYFNQARSIEEKLDFIKGTLNRREK